MPSISASVSSLTNSLLPWSWPFGWPGLQLLLSPWSFRRVRSFSALCRIWAQGCGQPITRPLANFPCSCHVIWSPHHLTSICSWEIGQWPFEVGHNWLRTPAVYRIYLNIFSMSSNFFHLPHTASRNYRLILTEILPFKHAPLSLLAYFFLMLLQKMYLFSWPRILIISGSNTHLGSSLRITALNSNHFALLSSFSLPLEWLNQRTTETYSPHSVTRLYCLRTPSLASPVHRILESFSSVHVCSMHSTGLILSCFQQILASILHSNS